jgi:hypothetical protein
MEGDPHKVIEGLMIAAYAIGADEGFIYVRAEYPVAVTRLKKAIKEAREYGLLGQNILGSDFSFDITIKEGAGAFVCGEETALISSIEGRRGMPSPRPPYPAAKGLFGKADHHQQRGDPFEFAFYRPKRRRLVQVAWDRDKPGHENICPCRSSREHRPGRSAYGVSSERPCL